MIYRENEYLHITALGELAGVSANRQVGASRSHTQKNIFNQP
ncbi:MAG TPA: hypothetical protein V6D31_06390 [Candidatus Sericytochromatia bacterium]